MLRVRAIIVFAAFLFVFVPFAPERGALALEKKVDAEKLVSEKKEDGTQKRTVLSYGEFIETKDATEAKFKQFVADETEKAKYHPCVLKAQAMGYVPEIHYSFTVRDGKTVLEIWSEDCD